MSNLMNYQFKGQKGLTQRKLLCTSDPILLNSFLAFLKNDICKIMSLHLAKPIWNQLSNLRLQAQKLSLKTSREQYFQPSESDILGLLTNGNTLCSQHYANSIYIIALIHVNYKESWPCLFLHASDKFSLIGVSHRLLFHFCSFFHTGFKHIWTGSELEKGLLKGPGDEHHLAF